MGKIITVPDIEICERFKDNLGLLKEPRYIEEGLYGVVYTPYAIFSTGFEKCLGVTLYEPDQKILGVAHLLYENPDLIHLDIGDLINHMVGIGADRKKISAKLNGETYVKRCAEHRKSESARIALELRGIPVVAEYLGMGSQAMIAHSDNGQVDIYNFDTGGQVSI